MSKSCKNLANQTLFNLHLFDNVRYVFGDGDLGAHRRLAGAAADFPAADDGKPRHVGTELVVAVTQDSDFLVERINLLRVSLLVVIDFSKSRIRFFASSPFTRTLRISCSSLTVFAIVS